MKAYRSPSILKNGNGPLHLLMNFVGSFPPTPVILLMPSCNLLFLCSLPQKQNISYLKIRCICVYALSFFILSRHFLLRLPYVCKSSSQPPYYLFRPLPRVPS